METAPAAAGTVASAVLLQNGVSGGAGAGLEVVKARLRMAAASNGLAPAIFKRRSGEAALLFEMGIRVHDWGTLKKMRGESPRFLMSGNLLARTIPRRPMMHHPDAALPPARPPAAAPLPPAQINPVPKLSRAIKSKSNGAGRTYTSKFRGVHQTFPTKRWEAQFRRNGKPTSLGCFDHEEEAARAYDKMMLWCELHNTAGVKGGITNYDPSEYDKDIPWLQSVSQDELIEALRSDGRRQAAHRMLRQKREGAPSGHGRRGRGASREAAMSDRELSEGRGGRRRASSAGNDSGGHDPTSESMMD